MTTFRAHRPRRVTAAELARRRAERAYRLALRGMQTHEVPDVPADRDVRDLCETS
jgi:hypothetical protein